MILSESEQKAVDEILDNFDFEKVHKAMVALDWRWASSDGVPDKSDLRRVSRGLLKEALEHKSCISTGGFKASYREEDKGLMLQFILDEWEYSNEILL